MACWLIALAVQLVLVAVDRVPLSGPADALAVSVGRPFPWITQDQSRYDPPYPVTTRLLPDPWELATHVDVLPMVASHAFIAGSIALLVCGVAAVRAARERRRA